MHSAHNVHTVLIRLLCEGVAFSLNFQWAAQGLMVQGHLCEIQGIVSQIGDLGAAIWSTAIAFHTFWCGFSSIVDHYVPFYHLTLVFCVVSSLCRLRVLSIL